MSVMDDLEYSIKMGSMNEIRTTLYGAKDHPDFWYMLALALEGSFDRGLFWGQRAEREKFLEALPATGGLPQ